MSSALESENVVSTIAISEEVRHPKRPRDQVYEAPLVKLILETFPGTTLVDIENT